MKKYVFIVIALLLLLLPSVSSRAESSNSNQRSSASADDSSAASSDSGSSDADLKFLKKNFAVIGGISVLCWYMIYSDGKELRKLWKRNRQKRMISQLKHKKGISPKMENSSPKEKKE